MSDSAAPQQKPEARPTCHFDLKRLSLLTQSAHFRVTNNSQARAKTGTGKTIGFLIPAFERMNMLTAGSRAGAISCLIISPTRELATQIATEAKVIANFHGMSVQTVMGGTNQKQEQRRLAGGCDVLVATPGRLQDHLDNSAGFKPSCQKLKILILDEADQLLEMGFKREIEKILRSLPSPDTRQTLLFSATVPAAVQQVAKSALRQGQNQYIDCIGAGEANTNAAIDQSQMVVSIAEMIPTMVALIEMKRKDPNHKIIVFFSTARMAQFFAELLRLGGIPALDIHSRKSQSQRTKTSEQFKRATSAVMMSSDVSARGMDYPDVTYVLQVGCASTREQYVHRIGRCGRAGKKGEAMILLCDFESFFLNELKGFPVKQFKPPSGFTTTEHVGVALAISRVASSTELSERASQTYGAWLGFYKGLLRKMRWQPFQLVQCANELAKLIGCGEQPALQRRTVGKMGLKGCPGLRIIG
jgi:ATP-dependent RNA helicase MSS116